uniref:Xylulose kinase-1 n=1 Tax=Tanacetum cinerariifolium TaxID=118510 RepID=A0A6L2NMA2_TANCI|nr:hypothetical protein [Tanacetum cinerariifolium]
MALTFADTHNMIAYLTKSDASVGFNQIINFLNGSSIKYALTVNPNIYVSCIKQFWTSVSMKKVNDVTRLQALVDKKRVIIMEATIRDALQLADVEGIDCLPNKEIFTKLARMGYEKPSTKLTFTRHFFKSMEIYDSHHTIILVRNVDSPTKFYMYSRFLQLMIRGQVGDLSSHTTKYSSPDLTQKVFANMRRVRKGCSGVETPLFEGMLVAQQVDESTTELNDDDVHTAGVADEGVAEDKIAQALKITKLKQRVKKLERRNKLKGRMIANMDADFDVTLKDIAKDVVVDAETEESADIEGRQAESQAQIYQIDLEHAGKVLSMKDDEVEPVELQKVVEVVTTAKLITEVVTAACATITAAAPQLTTAAVLTLTTAPSAARRRNEEVIRDPEETATPSTIFHTKAKSKDKGKGILIEKPKPLKKHAQIKQVEAYARELEAKLKKNIDWDEVIDHVQRKEKEDNAVKRYQALKRKPQTESQARKNMMIYLRNMVGFKMDYFKGMTYVDIQDSRALKRISKSQEDKAAKKQKLDKEVTELKRHLQIVPNDEDDVYTEATPLARKVPVVDYEIYTGNNKPYY